MKKRIILEEKFFQTDFLLIGFVSTLPIFKLAWEINRVFNFQLEEVEPIEFFDNKKEKNIAFLRFLYNNEEMEMVYSLIQNKFKENILLKKAINMDYILKIEGENTSVSSMLSDLKKIENITFALKINVEDLPKKHPLHILF